MAVPKIENFEEFLQSNIGKDSKIISYTSKYLTKPGDNYGSCMLAIKVKLQKLNESTEEESTLELVVKMPPTNEFFWHMFEPQRTCITENSIYIDLIPELKELQKNVNMQVLSEHNDIVDVYPKCYGIRTSLSNDSNIIDKNAILMLENLITLGYKVHDRLESFDYQHTIIALRDLAKYHAAPIALRMKKPKVFTEKIMPKIKRFNICKNFEKQVFDDMLQTSRKDIIMTIPEFSSKIEIIDNLIDFCCKYMENPDDCENSLYTTIAHYDFWVNNMMFLYDENENPLKIKLLDFQIAQYESLAHDIIFFLISSVKDDIIKEKYDEFLKYYYDEFINCLKLLDCETTEYSFKNFMDEIKRIAPTEFFHILTMLKVIFIEKQSLPDDFNDMKPDTMKNENAYSDKYFNKLKEFVTFYFNKGYMDSSILNKC